MLKVKTVRRAALAVTTAFAASGAIGLHAAQAPDPQPWIHLDMTGEQANMNLNLPLTAIEAALALAPEAIVNRDGQLQLGGEREIPVAAIREVWNQMRGAGDIEFANIQDGRQSIRVAREGDTIVVNVTGTDDDDAESDPDAESGRDAGQDRADAGRGRDAEHARAEQDRADAGRGRDAEHARAEQDRRGRRGRAGDAEQDRRGRRGRAGDAEHGRGARRRGRGMVGEVQIRVPVTVVDALLSGAGDTLDVRAAIQELSALRGEMVQVIQPDARIRVWIDESPTQ